METPPPPPSPCTQVDPDLFFPKTDGEDPSLPTPAEQEALAVCAGCPLGAKAACLLKALDAAPAWHQWGVVGGATASQRKAILRRTAERRTAEYVAQLAEVA
ncbi:WhiB family transcriptional regulator [Kitasatospora indigofera]|uniref:WhiB family transcriptional regulator n=1 Tax=Kitasatospora indigofera TaxID=67307 RepID=UPI0036823ADF